VEWSQRSVKEQLLVLEKDLRRYQRDTQNTMGDKENVVAIILMAGKVASLRHSRLRRGLGQDDQQGTG